MISANNDIVSPKYVVKLFALGNHGGFSPLSKVIAQIGREPLHDECDGEENTGVMLNGTVEERLYSGTPAPRSMSNSGSAFIRAVFRSPTPCRCTDSGNA